MTVERTEVETYNYARFEGTEDFLAFRTVLPVGSAAPDFTATLLDTGEQVAMSQYWRAHDVLVEFGSFT